MILRDIRIVAEPFDPLAEQASLWAGQARVGALVSFIGLMRDLNEGHQVGGLILEHYPGMTEKALSAIADEATRRWPVDAIRILHRIGTLKPQDPIVLVAVAASHREQAFRCCEFLIDYLKTHAPFWKKELRGSSEHWVAARDSDTQAAMRWETKGI